MVGVWLGVAVVVVGEAEGNAVFRKLCLRSEVW